MLFLGKALKFYTAAYQNIQKIIEDDLELFQNCLYPQDSKRTLERSLSAKSVSWAGHEFSFLLRKDQQTEDDEEDKDLDVTEEEN